MHCVQYTGFIHLYYANFNILEIKLNINLLHKNEASVNFTCILNILIEFYCFVFSNKFVGIFFYHKIYLKATKMHHVHRAHSPLLHKLYRTRYQIKPLSTEQK